MASARWSDPLPEAAVTPYRLAARLALAAFAALAIVSLPDTPRATAEIVAAR